MSVIPSPPDACCVSYVRSARPAGAPARPAARSVPLQPLAQLHLQLALGTVQGLPRGHAAGGGIVQGPLEHFPHPLERWTQDRKSTRLNSSHVKNSYAVFCLKKKMKIHTH